MARKRRKGEERNGDNAKQRRKDQPLDTNAEILPAKPTAINTPLSIPEGRKLTGKKRKRLDKYIENKLRKEEAAALIKKLSERVVDTSYLRSTKTIGQAKSAKPETSRNGQWDTISSGEEDNSVDGIDGTSANSLSTTVPDQHPQEKPSQKNNEPIAGSALKPGAAQAAGRTSHSAKRQRSTKVSWRERLGDKRVTLGAEITEESESDMSSESGSESENESEESEWNGFSDGNESDAEVQAQASGVSATSMPGSHEQTDEGIEEEESVLGTSDTDDSFADGEAGDTQTRAKEFKEWAREQSGLGGTVSNISSLPQLPPELAKPKPLPIEKPDLAKIEKSQASFFVPVKRKPEIQESRLSLPIISEEQPIMETLSDNDCLVICGETGSGKTTQLPQFLFEAGYGAAGSEHPGIVGVTQPRRVAAVSMASRVAEELGSPHEKRVGYQASLLISCTSIKFMTDGVLLREIALDLLLSKYSAIVVDEAHERSVNTDVLIGVLSRVVKLRREMSREQNSTTVTPLKLIIMSATMRVTDFTANKVLFPQPPPVINVNARQFPVTIHFSKRTALTTYVDDAIKKISKIHQRLPPGGILVFLTGQDEIRDVCNKLRSRFPAGEKVKGSDESTFNPRVKCLVKQMDMEVEDIDVEHDSDSFDDENTKDDSDDSDDSDFEDFGDFGENDSNTEAEPLHVLPLFSLLPVSDQLKVFQPVPDGSRLCVVATNIAETSLTIPGIKYVVDCGRVKERVYDKATGVESFQIGWISKASAAQRTGRAGRTGPGHCYRLYSSAIFERDFAKFSEPEILKYPIEGIVLQMKGMRIEKVVNFPFPTSPNRESLKQAEKLLENLGALDKDRHITALGESMSAFPLQPRYSKMIILGQQFDNMPYLIAIVAGLSVGDPFISLEELEGFSGSQKESEESNISGSKRRKFDESRQQFSALDPGCDVLRLLCAIGAYEASGAGDGFCTEHFLRVKVMKDIRKLRIQITSIVNNQLPGIIAPVEFTTHLPPPSSLQIRTIKQVVAAAYLDRIAIRGDLVDSNISHSNSKTTLRAKYLPMTSPNGQAPTMELAFIHPRSAVANMSTAPEYIVYSDIRASQKTGRLRLIPLTTVSAREIEPLARGTPLIQYSKPLNYPTPRVFSENGIMKKEVYVVPRFGTQGRAWELPSIKRVENLVKG